uniref:RING-type E3 ubiquitin transferase n=1 Tax=Quercus lobata TaxID=97700 RepID=A0A7N2L730_QUELO
MTNSFFNAPHHQQLHLQRDSVYKFDLISVWFVRILMILLLSLVAIWCTCLCYVYFEDLIHICCSYIGALIHNCCCRGRTISSPVARPPSSNQTRTQGQDQRGMRYTFHSRPRPWNQSYNGVHPTKILALPLYPYRANSNQINECVICLSEFEEEEAVKEIPFCKHAFHAYCLDMWLSVQKTCPLCRTSRLDANHDVCIDINEGVGRGPVVVQA